MTRSSAADYAERMRVTSGGTVGINTSSPNTDSVLYVKGRTSGGDGYTVQFVNSSGTNLLLLRNDGLSFMKGIYDNTNSNAANVWVNSDGSMYRSTSSIKYKKM